MNYEIEKLEFQSVILLHASFDPILTLRMNPFCLGYAACLFGVCTRLQFVARVNYSNSFASHALIGCRRMLRLLSRILSQIYLHFLSGLLYFS
jgi:hypothetical protein